MTEPISNLQSGATSDIPFLTEPYPAVPTCFNELRVVDSNLAHEKAYKSGWKLTKDVQEKMKDVVAEEEVRTDVWSLLHQKGDMKLENLKKTLSSLCTLDTKVCDTKTSVVQNTFDAVQYLLDALHDSRKNPGKAQVLATVLRDTSIERDDGLEIIGLSKFCSDLGEHIQKMTFTVQAGSLDYALDMYEQKLAREARDRDEAHVAR